MARSRRVRGLCRVIFRDLAPRYALLNSDRGQEGLSRPIHDVHIDTVGDGVEAEDQIGRPVGAGLARVVEAGALVQRPLQAS